MTGSLFQAASEYLERGWSVIPMRQCADAKKPAVRWKSYQTTRPTDRHIKRWFDGKTEPTGLAIIFGAVSENLAQRDFDTLDSYTQWSQDQPALAAELPTVKTRRGLHVYFRSDPAELADLRKKIGSTGNGAIKLPDGELRADVGCYSVAPSSRHPTGFVYEWLKPLPEAVPAAPLAAFYSPEIDVNPECYTCNVSDVLAAFAVSAASDGVFDDKDLEQLVKNAIVATIPSGYGQRNRQIFEFVRRLKAIPQIASIDADVLEPLIRRWHSQALPAISTKGFTETLIDFLVAWKRAKIPAGAAAIGPIFQRAIAAELPEAARRYDEEPRLQLLVALCRELHRSAGNAPFFLSCAKAGELLGAQPMTIWRWIELLKAHNILRLTSKGTKGRKGQASEYRYLPKD